MSTVTVDQQDDDVQTTSTGKTDEELLCLAREQYKAADDACSDNYDDALDDLNFLSGGTNQWDAQAVLVRTAQKRPMITVNVLPTYLHQVTNDQRMNTPAIKVHPVDDNADVEVAKVIQGLIRHIEYDSNADVAEDTAVNSAAAIGFGWFRLITEYADDGSFNNQDIKYARIRNALSVKIDPLSVEPDGSDMKYAFIECLMSKAEFKRKYPKANASDDAFFNEGDANAQSYAGWYNDASVLVCEWYCIETDEAEIIELSTGEVGFADELLPPGGEKSLPDGITIARRRKGERSKVMWYRITGCDVLERTEIKCKWIPLFPVYGDEIDIQGQVIRSGIIRNAKGPAQMYNVFLTSATEEVALRGKNPYIMAEGQEEGHEDEWAQINVTPLPYATYKPVALGDKLAPPPQRNPMADIPVGHLQMAMHSSDNIKKTTGLFDASLGARGTATSGKQELAQQREGDVANFHYMDGLLRSLRHCGRCLVSMIPHYYDTQRTIRILGEGDIAQHVTINEPSKDEIGRVLNDVTMGKYDVTVTNGASFTTMRQESADFFATALQASKDPAQAAVMGYLAIKNQDINDGETATKMLATLLPAPAKAVLDEENGKNNKDKEQIIPLPDGPLPVSQVPQAIDALKQQIMQAHDQLKEADVAKQQAEAAKQQSELIKQQNDAERIKIEQTNAETARLKVQIDADKAAQEAAQAEIDNLFEHERMEIEARASEAIAANGDTQAFEAWKATLESQTRIRVAEITAHSNEQRAAMSARASMERPKQKPPAGETASR